MGKKRPTTVVSHIIMLYLTNVKIEGRLKTELIEAQLRTSRGTDLAKRIYNKTKGDYWLKIYRNEACAKGEI